MTTLPAAEIFTVDQPLPFHLRRVFVSEMAATGGIVDLPNQQCVFRLVDYSPADDRSFAGPAVMRVARLKTCLLLSPVFGHLNFDIIWTPAMGMAANAVALKQPGPQEHLHFSFILTDADMIIRAIRTASMSPAVGMALWRAQTELASKSFTGASVIDDVNALFQTYPVSMPDGIFHEICAFGD